jgi:hypothetical protein
VRCNGELGLGVFPVDPELKKPWIKGWQKGGLRQEASIVKVFGRFAEEAVVVGVATGFPVAGGGYLYVLDVDGRNGGLEALAALPELPETVTAKTKDGAHYWFRTATPQPSYTRDGLELKGVGAQVVIPPAPGRSWIRNPFEFEIAECPAFLLPQPDELRASEQKPLRVVVDRSTGEVLVDLSNPLQALRDAKPGSRTNTLLRVAGSMANKVRRGLVSETQAREELLATSLGTGLTQEDSLRVIDWCFRNNKFKTSGEGREALRTLCTCHTVTERHLEVLSFVCSVYEEDDRPFEKQVARPFSARWVCGHTSLDHPMKAKRTLDDLCAAQLLWLSPSRVRYKPGQKACKKYRPTYAGLTVAGVSA